MSRAIQFMDRGENCCSLVHITLENEKRKGTICIYLSFQPAEMWEVLDHSPLGFTEEDQAEGIPEGVEVDKEKIV